MMAFNTADRKSIRLKFFGIYALSIGCVALICAAVFRKEPPAPPAPQAVTVYLPAPASAITHVQEPVFTAPAAAPVPAAAAAEPRPEPVAAAVAPPPVVTKVQEVVPNEVLENLKTVIREKDRRISQLSQQLKEQPRSTSAAAVQTAAYAYKPAKGETVEALKQSNANLQQGFKDIMNKLWESYRSYNLLKKENEQLRKQLASR